MAKGKTITIRVPEQTFDEIKGVCSDLGEAYNFNQFVNSYRLKEAKILLKQTPELSISEVSELSGFGSVNSFLRIFKNTEKITPTEYRNK